MPFYQLENASFNTTDPNYKFKKLIFENVVDMIESSINMLDVTAVKTEVDAATGKLNKTKVWNREIDYLGTALKALNQGQVEGKTYIKYLLGTSPDLEKLIRAMAEQGALDAVLTPVFEATICSTMKGDVINGLNTLIDTVDAGAESVTGVDPHSPQADSTFTKAKTISTIIASAPMYISTATHHLRLPEITLLIVLAMLTGKREIIPAKRIMEMPFPMPYSVICSPSHIISAEPEVNVSTITIAAQKLSLASATISPLFFMSM